MQRRTCMLMNWAPGTDRFTMRYQISNEIGLKCQARSLFPVPKSSCCGCFLCEALFMTVSLTLSVSDRQMGRISVVFPSYEVINISKVNFLWPVLAVSLKVTGFAWITRAWSISCWCLLAATAWTRSFHRGWPSHTHDVCDCRWDLRRQLACKI